MCKVRYIHKLSSAVHRSEGFELEVEVCDNPKHDDAFVEMLGKRALDVSKRIRSM